MILIVKKLVKAVSTSIFDTADLNFLWNVQDEKLGKLKSKYADLESSHNQVGPGIGWLNDCMR